MKRYSFFARFSGAKLQKAPAAFSLHFIAKNGKLLRVLYYLCF